MEIKCVSSQTASNREVVLAEMCKVLGENLNVC